MKPLLRQASRALSASANCIAASPPSRGLLRAQPSICLSCQYRTASTAGRANHKTQLRPQTPGIWSRRPFSSSARWLEERKPPNEAQPIPMPPPASDSKPTPEDAVEERARRLLSSIESEERLREQPNTIPGKEASEEVQQQDTPKADQVAAGEAQQPAHEEAASGTPKGDAADTITRVPDEQLPSHRERQRWDLSKRLSKLMDEVLPKLAAVTQKVNTYTGTDYSGVAALRQEIKEQENLVKTRRAAIDTAKQSLDTAHAQQASAQKEVVALLERKHSWSAGDLERYMSLIRSEHINDQAIRVAKESVISAEAALEESRTQLEKRERAQYHEEQIWSDTIRRNSTWVTFVLMGVNIFLLLLSLAILEPWRRRRMVREIKDVLETQRPALAATPSSSAPAVAPTPDVQDTTAIEEEIDRIIEADDTETEAETPIPSTLPEQLPIAEAKGAPLEPTIPETSEPAESVIDPHFGVATPGPVPVAPESLPQPTNQTTEPTPSIPDTWQGKVTAIAEDIVSHRVISMRRIDYTTAILQGAAAGAVIMVALMGMFGQN